MTADADDLLFVVASMEQINSRQLAVEEDGRFEVSVWLKIDGEDTRFIRRGPTVGTALVKVAKAAWESLE